MNFSFLTCVIPRTRDNFFGGGGWGVKTSLPMAAAVCGFGLGSGATFLYMDHLTYGGSPGSELRVPCVGPPMGPCE